MTIRKDKLELLPLKELIALRNEIERLMAYQIGERGNKWFDMRNTLNSLIERQILNEYFE